MRRAYPAEAFNVASSQSQPSNPFSPIPTQPPVGQPIQQSPFPQQTQAQQPNPNVPIFQSYTPQPQTQQPQVVPTHPSVSPLVPSTPIQFSSGNNNSQVSVPPPYTPTPAPQSLIPSMVNNNNNNQPPQETFKAATVTTTVAPKLEFFDEEGYVPVSPTKASKQAYPAPPTQQPTHGIIDHPPPLNPNEFSQQQPPQQQAPVYQQSQLAPPPYHQPVVGKRPIPMSEVTGQQGINTFAPNSQQGSSSPGGARSFELSGVTPTPRPEWKAPAEFCQLSIDAIPRTDALLDKVGIPLGITFHPLADTKKPVPLINFGSCGIIRCRKCRAYINPYVTFIEGGKRWKCNICYLLNDVPKEYFSVVGADGLRLDHATRPELSYGCVEFVASAEFAQRPPQPPVYLFIIDVSYTSVASGMVNAICRSIKKAIELHLSKNERTQVGFMTFNSTIQFYNLKSTFRKPRIMVIDFENPFVPFVDDMLVNPRDSQELIDYLLDELLLQNVNGTNDTNSALGAALECGYQIMQKLGGKIVVFQSVLPNVGPGKLQNRAINAKDQTSLFQPSDQFYKSFALECCKKQISCDLFLYSPAGKYVDVATIGCLAQFTGGEVNYYQLSEHSSTEAQHLYYDLYRTLTRNTGFEAVMKLRMSKGISLVSHHGSFFLRGQDLVSLPNLDSDKSYSFRVKISDSKSLVSANNQAQDGKYYASIQAGLLYTTYTGERRIRVITACAPITEQLSELFNQVQIAPAMNIIAKLAISKVLENGIQLATAAIKETCINTLSHYSNNFVSSNNDSVLMLPNSLVKFPLYTLALMKNSIFQVNTNVDERINNLLHFNTLSSAASAILIHPTLYNLTAITSDMGIAGENGEMILPPEVELTAEKLDRRGVFLLDNGKEFYLWIGGLVEPPVLQALFDIQSLQQVDSTNSQLQVFRRDNEFSQRVNNIIDSIRSKRSGYQWLYPIKEKDPHEYKFFSHLVQDRFADNAAFRDFAVELKSLVSKRRVR